jgi:plastocyanin
MFADTRAMTRYAAVAACAGCLLLPALGSAAARSTATHSHVVRMVGDATSFRFEPSTLEIASGDTVVFEVVSGQPHDVAFDTTAIAPAVVRQLSVRLRDQIAPLAGPLLVQPGERYAVAFDGIGAGRYPFYCLPHQALRMKGEVVVR